MLELAGVHAPILCFDMKANHDLLFDSLVDRGYLTPGMEILNVFDHYRSAQFAPDSSREQVDIDEWATYFSEARGLTTEEVTDSKGRLYGRITKNAANVIVYRQGFRSDGSLFFLDASRLDSANKVLNRTLWLIDPQGRSVAAFSNATAFYRRWLTELSEGQNTTFIFDDKVAATNLRSLDLPNAIKITPIHSNHIKSAGDPDRGEVDPNRSKIVSESYRWDGLVFLTHEQREDYARRFGRTNNLFVVPNPSRRLDSVPETHQRDTTRGVMLGKLVANKNIDAAIEIISVARESVPDIRLDVYGEGPLRETLQKKIFDRGLQNNITLKGHETGASAHFKSSAFSLVTSRYEGFSLALLESMGSGCPPIAFDFRYGPRTLIDSGKTGYLVENGNVTEAAARVVAICRYPDLASRLGENAWIASADYDDEAILRQWADVIVQAWNQKDSRHGPLRGTVTPSSVVRNDDASVTVSGSFSWGDSSTPELLESTTLSVSLTNRLSGPAVTVPVALDLDREKTAHFSTRLSEAQIGQAASAPGAGNITDVHLLFVAHNLTSRHSIVPESADHKWAPAISDKGQVLF